MSDYVKTFPETQAASGMEPDESGAPAYIGSSESVGCGHEDFSRMPTFSNGEFPNEESGEGRNGS